MLMSDARPPLSKGLVLLLAVACGVGVANLYYAQPILDTIARSFGTSPGTAGLVVTFGQIGYAAGLALLVPLGDLVSRRRLVPTMLLITTAGLLASAAAPAIGVLIAVALIVGVTSVVAQLLIPMAASLADDAHRGQVVGTVMSGLLLGILLARTIAGVVAGVSSWRAVYLMAAILTAVMAVVLGRLLPPETERPAITYRTLLASTVRLVVTEPVLRRRSLYGALAFAAFSAFWTTMAFLLAGTPYHYTDATIGLFGLVGAGGAICANLAGRWADRGLTKSATVAFSLCLGASFLPLWYGRHSLAMLIVGIVILDIGAQGLMVTNQSIIYRLVPHARSRVNSVYMVCYFAGGAAGSALASSLYASHGWAGVTVLGAAIGLIATLIAIADARLHLAPLAARRRTETPDDGTLIPPVGRRGSGTGQVIRERPLAGPINDQTHPEQHQQPAAGPQHGLAEATARHRAAGQAQHRRVGRECDEPEHGEQHTEDRDLARGRVM
jgi:predicted MFS family arabinose efflux permease